MIYGCQSVKRKFTNFTNKDLLTQVSIIMLNTPEDKIFTQKEHLLLQNYLWRFLFDNDFYNIFSLVGSKA